MIKYKLTCNNCENNFDSWFASSKEYEKLKKLKHLSCHYCNSIKVEKTLMSPNILNSKDKKLPILRKNKFNKHFRKLMLSSARLIVATSIHVGGLPIYWTPCTRDSRSLKPVGWIFVKCFF